MTATTRSLGASRNSVRLSDIAEVTAGGSAPQDPNDFGEGIPFVRVSHLSSESHQVIDCDSLTIEAVRRHRLRIFPAGTIILPKSGASIRLEKRAVLPFDACLVSHLAAILPRPERVEGEYLFFWLQGTPLATEKADGYPTLRLSEIANIVIPLPSLEEQRRISQILLTLRAAGLATEHKTERLEATKAALVDRLFRETESREARLEDIASIERGRFTHRPRNDPRFYGGDIPFIQTGDVTSSATEDGFVRTHSQTLNERGLEVSRLFPAGTIAITIAANIGFVARLTYPAAFPDSIIAITPYEGVDPAYLAYFLATQQQEMDRRAPRGTQKNINIEFLRPWPVPVPSLADQQRIAHAVSSTDRAIRASVALRRAIDTLFVSISSELLEGVV